LSPMRRITDKKSLFHCLATHWTSTNEGHREQSDLRAYEPRIDAHELKREDLLREREIILDLYKCHMHLLLQANVFIYAVTGALLSFVFTHLSIPHIRWVLVFPVLFAVAFAIFFWLARKDIDNNKLELLRIAKALKVNVYPRIDALPLGLSVSSLALFVMAVVIALGGFLIR
jgi:hypothetical protein